jgi:hypothetical protein
VAFAPGLGAWTSCARVPRATGPPFFLLPGVVEGRNPPPPSCPPVNLDLDRTTPFTIHH